MRADNNWEDSVGKKLYDFEGELAPMAWDRILKDINKPPRRPKGWLLLPLILLLSGLSALLYFNEPFNFTSTQTGTTEITSTAKKGQTNPENTAANGASISSFSQNQELKNSEAPAEQNPSQAPAITTLPETGTIVHAENHGGKTAENVMPGKGITGTIKKPVLLAGTSNHSPDSLREKKKGRIVITKRPLILIAKNERNLKTRKGAENKEVPGKQPPATVATAARIVLDEPDKPALASNNSESSEQAKNSIPSGEKPVVAATMSGTEKQFETKATEPKTAGSESAAVIKKYIKETNTIAFMPLRNPELPLNNAQFALPQFAVAQDSSAEEEQVSKKKWAFTVYGAPQFTYLRVMPNAEDEKKILAFNNKNDFSTERVGYELGLRAAYPVTPKLQFETGLQFAHVRQYLNLTTTTATPDSMVMTETASSFMAQVVHRERKETHLFKYTFAGIYAGASYAVLRNIHITGGAGLNWLLLAKPENDIAEHKLNPYISAGLQFTKPISNSVMLQAGPVFQYYLQPVQQDKAEFSAKPAIIGFSVGLRFNPKP